MIVNESRKLVESNIEYQGFIYWKTKDDKLNKEMYYKRPNNSTDSSENKQEISQSEYERVKEAVASARKATETATKVTNAATDLANKALDGSAKRRW